MAGEGPKFDPLGLLQTLERHRVAYIVVGGFARIVQGAEELTSGLDVVPRMRSGDLIREARLRAGLTQTELAEKTSKDRSVIARWEQGVVAPSVETLISLVRACEFDLSLELVRYEPGRAERLGKNLMLSPERRVQRYLSALEREES